MNIKHNWLKFLIIIALTISICFRFVGLSDKVYWHDEALTSLRISGYTVAEMSQTIAQGQIITIPDLQQYQKINSTKNWLDTIKCVAQNALPHSPLYFVLARFWAGFWGDQIATIRSLSVVLSFLIFPCAYWLCLELFGSTLVGNIVVILMAVSPFHLIYAQEARPYSLWIGIILLSSALLLRAIKQSTKLNWGLYAITIAIGLYTFIFTALLVFAQGIYLIAIERFKLTKTIKSFLVSSVISGLIYAPWLWVMITNFNVVERQTKWTKEAVGISQLVRGWLRETCRIFFDFNQWQIGRSTFLFLVPLIFLVFLLITLSLIYLCRKTPPKTWLLVMNLVVINALPLIVADVFLGGQRSTIGRYLILSYLGIQLAVSYYLANLLDHKLIWFRRIGQVSLGLILCYGLISQAIVSQVSQVKCHPTKSLSCDNLDVAALINQTNQPLVISNFSNINIGNLISLSYELKPDVKLQLVVPPNLPKIPDGFSDIFIYTPAKYLSKELSQKSGYQLKSVFKSTSIRLDRLIKN